MRSSVLAVVGAVASIVSLNAAAAEFYVTTGGNDTDNDGTEGAPFKTLARAVTAANVAIDGGEENAVIYLAPGTYESSSPVAIAKPISVFGTGASPDAVVLKNASRKEADGADGDHRLVSMDHYAALLAGVTLQDGYTWNWGAGKSACDDKELRGGCASVWSGTISNCVVRGGNQRGWNGYAGGVYLGSSTALLTHSVVRGCTCQDSDQEGWAPPSRGGGVLVRGGRMENCLVTGNSINLEHWDGSAGGVRVENGGTVVNCTIANNTAKVGIGGVYFDGPGGLYNTVVYNCKNNNGPSRVGGWGAFVCLNCAGDGDFANGQSCLTVDATAFSDAANGDFTPRFGSALIDAGANGYTAASLDLAGAPRVQGAAIDIGCYEVNVRIPIEVTVVESEFGTVTLSKDEFYAGEELTVTATPGEGCRFLRWDGDVPAEFATSAEFTFTPTASVRLVPRFVPEGAQPTVFVATNGSDSDNTGFSEDSPKASVRAAVSLLSRTFGAGTVTLAPGTYTEADVIVVTDAIRIVGAGATPEDVVLKNGKDRGGEYDARNLVLDHPGASAENLTLQGGATQNWGGWISAYRDPRGGCALVYGGMISNCVIRGGQQLNWNSYAGGVYLWGDDAFLTHSVVSNCTCLSDDADWSTSKAGGVWIEKGRAENCLIAYNRIKDDNRSDGAGGLRIGTGTAANCTVVGNSAVHTGGIFVWGGQAVNCAIGLNTSTGGNASWANWSDDAFVKCAATEEKPINDTCVVGTAAELFINANAGGFMPSPGSPLIDAGVDGATGAATDLAGGARVKGAAIDIGCYEADDVQYVTISVADVKFGKTLGAGKVVAGEEVTITAVPNEGYVFDRWEGDLPEEFVRSATFTFHPMVYYSFRPFFVPAGTEPVQYVAEDGDDARHDGFAADDARRTLASAIARLVETWGYGTVFVAPGYYSVAEPVEITAAIRIVGTGATPANVTVSNSSRDIGPENKGAVFYVNNAQAMLCGLTVSDGVMTDWGAFNQKYKAGGVHLQAGVVSNCVVKSCLDNGHNTWAGGVYLGSSGAVLTHSTIRDCSIRPNGQESWNWNKAGGVCVSAGRADNCLVIGNYIDFDSTGWNGKAVGGVLVEGGELLNCTVIGNRAYNGGGVSRTGGTVVNTAIIGNTLWVRDGGSSNDFAVLGDSSGYVNCATDTAQPINIGSVVVSEADFRDFSGGKYVPRADGTLRDAGASGWDYGTTDWLGRERVVGKAVDIGCCECQGVGFTVIIK